MDEKILLGHGSGGQMTSDLIEKIFIKHFSNDILLTRSDSAVIQLDAGNVSVSTDSFVVDPVFFPGGDIGKLAIAGTVNDLAVSGADPLYLTAGFILEEGFLFSDLEKIVVSMAEEARKSGVRIVSGDTKVVDKGKCDKIFINTTGIGRLQKKFTGIGEGVGIKPGDKILINGTIGDHGMSIIAARENLTFTTDIRSDCACLNRLIKEALKVSDNIRFMRDPTRGGVATVLCELTEGKDYGIEIDEAALPLNENVRGMCEMLGFDPMYVANEGKVLMVVDEENADIVLETLKKNEFGRNAAIIGEVTGDYPGKTWMKTGIGGKRIIDKLAGEQLPRIC